MRAPHASLLARCLCAMTLALAPRAGAQSDTGWTALQRTVDEERRARGIPGVVVVVADSTGVRYRRAFGVADAATNAALTTAHLMQVGSITKTFTALLASELSARGRLDLDAPIGRALPGLSSRLGQLTERQLLTQSSGVRDVPGGDGPDAEGELLAYVKALGDSMVVVPPGEAFSYSNAGFALAGAAMQEGMHRPYADLLRQAVLVPLGMTRSTMRPAEALRLPHATGHVGKPGESGVVRDSIDNDARLAPAGYLWSSGDELGRFLGALVGRADRLARGVVDTILAPRVAVPGLPNDTRYGLGAFTDRFHGEASAWHPGSVTGYSALWRTIPGRRLGVVVVVNRDGVRLDRIVEAALLDAARQAGRPLADASPAVAAQPGGGRPSDTDLEALAGVYEARFPLELRWREGKLWLTRFGATLPVTPLGDQRFAVTPPGAPAADVFRIVSAHDGWPPYIQMFLWSFPRVRD